MRPSGPVAVKGEAMHLQTFPESGAPALGSGEEVRLHGQRSADGLPPGRGVGGEPRGRREARQPGPSPTPPSLARHPGADDRSDSIPTASAVCDKPPRANGHLVPHRPSCPPVSLSS